MEQWLLQTFNFTFCDHFPTWNFLVSHPSQLVIHLSMLCWQGGAEHGGMIWRGGIFHKWGVWQSEHSQGKKIWQNSAKGEIGTKHSPLFGFVVLVFYIHWLRYRFGKLMNINKGRCIIVLCWISFIVVSYTILFIKWRLIHLHLWKKV